MVFSRVPRPSLQNLFSSYSGPAKFVKCNVLSKRSIGIATSDIPAQQLKGLGNGVSHPDPGSDSPSGQVVSSHSPYLLATYSRPSLVFTRGEGSYLWDVENRCYIDFTAGIAVNALGHADPEVSRLLYDQSRQLIHVSNLYHNPWTGELAKLIVQKTIASGAMQSASEVFFGNSGTEANEAALKFARKVGKLTSTNGGKDKIGLVSFRNSFHGRTMGALSLTPNPKYQVPFAPMVPGVKVGVLNDINGLDELITEETCGVIVEPIQGEGGVFEVTQDFLRALRKRCNDMGAVLIFDEIQCGLGRTGNLWAHQIFGKDCHPDIITMAKPLANGLPIGATLVSQRISDMIKIGDHGTTFGGNPLVCRIAHHVFSRLSSPSLLSHVSNTSQTIMTSLQSFQSRFPSLISDIRGRGLILGVQLTKDPNPLVKLAREKGLLIMTAGHDTLRLVPPLVIEEDVVKLALEILERSFEDWERMGKDPT